MIFQPRKNPSAKRLALPLAFVPFLLSFVAEPVVGQRMNEKVTSLELAGDLDGARALLTSDAASNPAAQGELAEFLCRHGDSGCLSAFAKWAAVETDSGRKQQALRQLVLLDYINGKDLSADLSQYSAAGGTDLTSPSKRKSAATYATVTIPGPLASFARMAALSPDLAPEDLLPALARNIVTNGYEASGNEALQQTEFLKLLLKYVAQARELQGMAKEGKITIPTCDSEETGALLKVIGYRMRGSCGADIVLETVNPSRAFLTVDSGFPLTQLEQDLRANHRFELPYGATAVPVLYSADYWLAALNRTGQTDFLDAFLADPSLCRLYLGLSHLERPAAEALRKQASAAKLKIYAHVLDFFGGMYQIRDGAAVVPGSPKAWASLAGVSPSNPGAFFEKLLATDDGWLASYFDSLMRINGPTLTYLTQPERMKRFYDGLRGKVTSPGPARPVFRSSTDLMLLTNTLTIEPNGEVHVPGSLDVWKSLFVKHPHGKYDGKLTRSAQSWRNGDDLVEALFGLSRKAVENEPLKIFLVLSDIDHGRRQHMSADMAAKLIANYRTFGSQYVIFAESPWLSEASMSKLLDWAGDSVKMRDNLLRSDALGASQALLELWRILCRQNSIPLDARDEVFAKLLQPFSQIKSETEVFEAGRAGVNVLLAAAEPKGSGGKQERLMQLLVGKVRGSNPISPAENFLRVFDAQRLVSLDGLFAAAERAEKGAPDAAALKELNDQLRRLQETEPTRGSLSSEERNTLAVGYWSERHVDQERKLNVDSLMKGTEKKDAKALLAPWLRDSLVGIVYCYYAPPGSQVSLTNPLFVRSHDFVGPEGSPAEWKHTEVGGTGWPENAGGRLTGSMISVAYAIAEAEQNFLTPRREQALIWADLVPQIIAGVTVNRWRNIAPMQTRWVALHLQRGKALLALAAMNADAETRVMESLHAYLQPSSVEWIDDHLFTGDFANTVAHVPPSVLYAIAADPALKNLQPDLASLALRQMAANHPSELNPEAIGRAFGTPKPTLTHSYRPGLLYLRTFPALMGYSSRILAESWESNNLYYAALADEAGVPSSQLDAYVPEWNRAAIENIFATHLEDWPALLRSLGALASSVRQHGAQNTSAIGGGN